jgi:hypothetical protein
MAKTAAAAAPQTKTAEWPWHDCGNNISRSPRPVYELIDQVDENGVFHTYKKVYNVVLYMCKIKDRKLENQRSSLVESEGKHPRIRLLKQQIHAHTRCVCILPKHPLKPQHC